MAGVNGREHGTGETPKAGAVAGGVPSGGQSPEGLPAELLETERLVRRAAARDVAGMPAGMLERVAGAAAMAARTGLDDRGPMRLAERRGIGRPAAGRGDGGSRWAGWAVAACGVLAVGGSMLMLRPWAGGAGGGGGEVVVDDGGAAAGGDPGDQAGPSVIATADAYVEELIATLDVMDGLVSSSGEGSGGAGASEESADIWSSLDVGVSWDEVG